MLVSPEQDESLTSDLSFFLLKDSKAIVDGNLKLILGLVWTLILHYSISMPMWEGEDEEVTAHCMACFCLFIIMI